jgi:hypothetical protein
MGQKFVQSDYPTQSASQYPANIDADIKVMARLAASYNPCAEDAPSALKVVVQAGTMFINGALVANAAQTVTLTAAHATLPRIDRVVIDATTGVASKIDGVANASPVAPTITAGKFPVAQVLVTATMTIVGNSAITDERAASVADYEEGVWSPSTGASNESNVGRFARIGKLVIVNANLTITTLGAGSTNTVSGLPYAPTLTSSVVAGPWQGFATAISSVIGRINSGATSVVFYGATGTHTNIVTGGSTNLFGNACFFNFAAAYRI